MSYAKHNRLLSGKNSSSIHSVKFHDVNFYAKYSDQIFQFRPRFTSFAWGITSVTVQSKYGSLNHIHQVELKYMEVHENLRVG